MDRINRLRGIIREREEKKNALNTHRPRIFIKIALFRCRNNLVVKL